jgi:hypothetical protein
MSRFSSRKSSLRPLRVKRLALLAVVVGAVFALPSSALAASPEIWPAPAKYTVAGPTLSLQDSSGTWQCESANSGSGEWATHTSGTMNWTLKGCHKGTTSCTSAGQAKGTIVISTLKAESVWIDKAHTKPGVLFSPQNGGSTFAEFSCGFLSYKWTGSVIARISFPNMAQSSLTNTLSFETSSSAVQRYTQVEEEGAVHRLYQGGSPLAFEGSIKLTYPVEEKWLSA